MTFEAFVPCGCYEAGLTAPPPVPVEVCGGEVVPVEPAEENWLAVEEWQHDACPHRGMCLASDLLANIFWWGRFMGALELVGATEPLPTLLTELPGFNEGYTRPEECPEMLVELDRFLSSPLRWQVPVLRDAGTGRALGGEWTSFWGDDCRARPDANGHLVVTEGGGRVLLRARRLTQRVLRTGAEGSVEEVELCDLDTGTTCVTRLVLWHSEAGDAVPLELQVGLEPRGPRDYEDFAGRLRGLLEVAVAHGRPVRWT